jgi:hypothetical protein
MLIILAIQEAEIQENGVLKSAPGKKFMRPYFENT